MAALNYAQEYQRSLEQAFPYVLYLTFAFILFPPYSQTSVFIGLS